MYIYLDSCMFIVGTYGPGVIEMFVSCEKLGKNRHCYLKVGSHLPDCFTLSPRASVDFSEFGLVPCGVYFFPIGQQWCVSDQVLHWALY